MSTTLPLRNGLSPTGARDRRTEWKVWSAKAVVDVTSKPRQAIGITIIRRFIGPPRIAESLPTLRRLSDGLHSVSSPLATPLSVLERLAFLERAPPQSWSPTASRTLRPSGGDSHVGGCSSSYSNRPNKQRWNAGLASCSMTYSNGNRPFQRFLDERSQSSGPWGPGFKSRAPDQFRIQNRRFETLPRVTCTPPYHNFLQSKRNRGGVTASVADNVRSADWESLGRQRPKPADARARTVRRLALRTPMLRQSTPAE